MLLLPCSPEIKSFLNNSAGRCLFMLLNPLSLEGSVRTLVLRPEVPAEPDGVIDIPSTPPSAIVVVVVVEEDSPRRGSER